MNTFDNYINQKSFWHGLNPTVKLILSILLIVVNFLPIGFFGQIVSFVLLICVAISAKIRWKTIKSILITCAFMFVLLMFINWIAYKNPGFVTDIQDYHYFFGNWNNIFSNNEIQRFMIYSSETEHYCIAGQVMGGSIDPSLHFAAPSRYNYFNKYQVSALSDGSMVYLWYHAEWYAISTKVIFNSFSVTFKIMIMIFIITLLVSTTSDVQLTSAIGDLLSPLSLFKVPVNEWAMTISIAIRFVPSLLGEAQNILKAQASRGVDFKNGNFKDKAKSIVSLIIPMFSIAFRKADDLSDAMEARNYSPRAYRTSYRNYGFYISDLLAIFAIGIVFGFLVMYTAQGLIFGPFTWVDLIVIHG